MSHARRGEHYVRGHYGRDDGRSSYNRYSRDEGKEAILYQLGEMMETATTSEQRDVIRRALEELSACLLRNAN